ncbi:hypothetical protein B0I35DRAFT_483667 [Stachybotrys elegans]|uniref:Uncharacterized protein n=1 Tax=Stachybotrys elegans TaxID=80388 RepID=A0A8K0WL93_9HYPO|nr:hypothetical protein B0I35DRAFT_483667 [Stachybotrys elegans]
MAPTSVKRPHPFAFAALTAILALAYDSMFVQFARNGYLEYLVSVLGDDGTVKYIPGTTDPIRRHYLGIPIIDNFLTMANVFFVHTVDGSDPASSLFTFQLAAQIIPIMAILFLEESRVGAGLARRIFCGAVLWGLAMQARGFGLVINVYAMLMLALPRPASLQDMVLLSDPAYFDGIIPAFFLGYIVLCGLMAYRFESGDALQIANAVWQGFPLHMGAWLSLFYYLKKHTSIGLSMAKSSKEATGAALDHVYGFALTAGAVGQCTTYLVILVASVAPDVFPAGVADSLTAEKVLLPPPPHTTDKMESPAAAILHNLMYDELCGALALTVYALTTMHQVGLSALSVERLGGMALDWVTYGPVGAVAKALKQRDEYILAKI